MNDFKTHSLTYSQEGEFVKLRIAINNDIYNEMVVSSRACEFGKDIKSENNRTLLRMAMMFGVEPNLEYMFYPVPIENERYLIYRFIKSIFQEFNPNLYQFSSDEEYKTFCQKYNVTYESQTWFNNIYIRGSLDSALKYVLQQSLIFQELYFPNGSNRFVPTLRDVHECHIHYDFKQDFMEIYNLIVEKKIALYHFTDCGNIKSIKNEGYILSQKELRNRNLIPSYASSEESRKMDMIQGLDGYVRLSFVKSHPMMHTSMTCGRLSRPTILEINPMILLLPGVLVSDQNALKKSANIGSDVKHLKHVHFELFDRNYLDLDPMSKSYYQAEVLVPSRIGNDMILNYSNL